VPQPRTPRGERGAVEQPQQQVPGENQPDESQRSAEERPTAEGEGAHGDVKVHPSVAANAERLEKEDAPDEAPGGFSETNAPDKAKMIDPEEETGATSGAIVDQFQRLTRRELVRLQSFVSQALEGLGEDSELRGAGARGTGGLRETASELPTNEHATKEMELDDAAGKVDLPDGVEAVGHAVHARQRADGKPVGDKYLVVVGDDGSKHITKLDD
jgi:hypothetical protein